MKKILAKDFSSRRELDKHIEMTYGMNTQDNVKQDVVIEGTKSEFKKLGISRRSLVWGIPCSDPTPDPKDAPAPIVRKRDSSVKVPKKRKAKKKITSKKKSK